MNQKNLYRVFIWGFSALYLFVAAISFMHAIEFFSIGNNRTMSVMLALAFEVGLALSLVAILLSDKNRNNVLPWILMIILTSVQVIGNVYSVFKYISLSGADYYVYLQKSLLFGLKGIEQDMVQTIVSWIMGAILPIISLFMTDMVANNIRNMSEEASKNANIEENSKESSTLSKEDRTPLKREENVKNENLNNSNDSVKVDNAPGYVDFDGIPNDYDSEEKTEEVAEGNSGNNDSKNSTSGNFPRHITPYKEEFSGPKKS